MKRDNLVRYLLFGMAIILLFMGSFLESNSDNSRQTAVASGQALAEKGDLPAALPEVLRFHVLANSDSPEDQQLKTEVKDILVSYLKERLVGIETLAEAKALIVQEMPELERRAALAIKDRNYDYQVAGEMGIYSFPTRMYGDTIFPAGDYEAVRIIIGAGKGENWWCVLFPALCFIDGTKVVVATSSSNERLEHKATEKAFNQEAEQAVVPQTAEPKVKVRLKLIELISNLITNIRQS